MSEKDIIRKALKREFQTKQDRIEARPGQMGDGYGSVEVAGRDHYFYVRVAGKIEEVFNNRVPPENDLLVTVGFDPAQPNLYQVLSTRTTQPGGTTGGALVGYAPAIRYQYMAEGGGQDPLWVQKRQYLPLRIGPYSGMLIQVYRDIIWTGSAWATINTQAVDMTAHVPASTGKAALVLISLDDSAAVVATKGSEVDIADLGLDDLPTVPAGTREVLGAVRVYYGQTAVQEARTNTDIIDLRNSGWIAGGGALADHDHSGDIGDGGTFDAANLTSGAATDGYVLTADGSGGAAWEAAPGAGGGDSTTTAAYASQPAAGNDGDLFFPSDGYAVERDTGAAWQAWGPLFPFVKPPALSTWAWINQGTATASEANGGITIIAPAVAGDNMRILKRAAPSTPYTITAWLQGLTLKAVTGAIFGLVWRESSSGKITPFMLVTDGNDHLYEYNKWSSPTTPDSGYSARYFIDHPYLACMQIEDNGTSRIIRASVDGINFVQLFSVGRTDYLTADEVGFCVSSASATFSAYVTLLSWKVA